MNNKSEPPHSSPDFKLERRITELVNEYDSREIASAVSNLSISQLKRYMAGSSEPGLKPIGKLAEKKNISLDWVWDGEGSKYKKSDVIQDNTVREGNVNYVPEVNVGTLKSTTELMLKTSKRIEYDPPAVWSALIIELILAYGLTASGSERILETLVDIEKRNNEDKK